MKHRLISNTSTWTAVLLAGLLAGCVTAPKPQSPPTLKSAYKHYFYVGVAVNREQVTGTASANGFGRSQEMLDKDIALIKQQFNQISPENDLKWGQIQPNPGTNGYNFGPADAYVNFGLKNHMYIVGHNLVWHAQTPNWVFQASNSTSGVSNTPSPDNTARAAGTNGFGNRRFGRALGGVVVSAGSI